MSCRHIVPLLDAFVDGELSQEKMLELEQHLAECEPCIEHLRFLDAMRSSLRHAVHHAAEPSEGFSARLGATLAAERAREETRATHAERFDRLRWGVIGPLAAAASITLVLGGWIARLREEQARPSLPKDTIQASASSAEQVLDDLVDYHARPPAPQITEPSMVKEFEPEVGIPVRLPSLKQYGASWEGGSVVAMHSNRAAVFRYRLSNHPVTIYVYNATRVPLRGALEPRVVRDVPVHVGARRGYSIAALEQRGIGYAVATDLNDDESAELVASIH